MMPNCSQIGQISISALRHIPEQKETCLNMENQVQWWIKVSMTGVDMYRHVMGMSGTSHRLVFTNLRSWTCLGQHAEVMDLCPLPVSKTRTSPLSMTCWRHGQDIPLPMTCPRHIKDIPIVCYHVQDQDISIVHDLSETCQRHLYFPRPVQDISKTSLLSITCPGFIHDQSSPRHAQDTPIPVTPTLIHHFTWLSIFRHDSFCSTMRLRADKEFHKCYPNQVTSAHILAPLHKLECLNFHVYFCSRMWLRLDIEIL